MNVSPAFQAFAQEAPQHQQAWSEAVQALGAASALDDKTAALAYLAVMAAARLDSGLPFHVKMAKMHGATRDEVISAVLIGLPAVGNVVTASLPAAGSVRRGVGSGRRRLRGARRTMKRKVVGAAGLEPARPKPEDFKSPAYANSATPPRATAR